MLPIRRRTFALAAAVAATVSLVACGSHSPAAPSAPSTVSLPTLDSMMSDKVIGQSDAPITIIEYSSLTCPHCAAFHTDLLPLLQAGYLDTGKAKLIYRDYPLDVTALDAAMVARCSGDRYFDVLGRLYQSQSTWAQASSLAAALKQVVAPVGMTSAVVDACLADKDLQNAILAMESTGTGTFGVRATPTFIINGQKYEGAPSWSDFQSIMKELGA